MNDSVTPTMKIRGVRIAVDGTMSLTEVNYENIKSAIGGGYFQMISVGAFTMYMDEDGKMKRMERNELATMLATPFLFMGDYIAGPVLICGRGDADGNHINLTDEEIVALMGLTDLL